MTERPDGECPDCGSARLKKIDVELRGPHGHAYVCKDCLAGFDQPEARGET